ncbi:hypothetical protein GCM10020218_010860 [Dactylosporangium vinaceum]
MIVAPRPLPTGWHRAVTIGGMPILVVLATVLAVLTPELSLVLLGAAWTYFLIAPVLEARRRRVRDPSAAAERWLAGNPDPAEVAFVAGGPSRTPGARIPVLATTLATAGLLYPVRARPLVPPVWRQCAYLSASGIAASAVVLGLRHGWWGGYGAFGVLLGVGLVFGTIPMFVAPDPPGRRVRRAEPDGRADAGACRATPGVRGGTRRRAGGLVGQAR